MRLPVQVLGIVFRRSRRGIEFLLLKRTPKKGGFWQPVSGGLEEGETLRQALLRELVEECGLKEPLTIIEDVHRFLFTERDSLWPGTVHMTEFVYGVEVPEDFEPDISSNHCVEHEEWRWCSYEEALDLLYWDNNKDSFRKLLARL
ncbi:NUDIX pyrophosphatase [Candidatus Woesearchaeota archaeon]|nr:NUDIX pyrophosphatase [Candidatus Woesearchaeota archaeon]